MNAAFNNFTILIGSSSLFLKKFNVMNLAIIVQYSKRCVFLNYIYASPDENFTFFITLSNEIVLV